MSRLVIAYLFFALLSLQALAAQTVPMVRVDRSVIAIDDTLTLTIRVMNPGRGANINLSPLEDDFHVLANSQSSSHVNRNGQYESWTEWTISLAPKRQGQLTIPAISVGGEASQPVSITVLPSPPQGSTQLSPVYLETEVDLESAYVQQQIIFTLRIFRAIQLDNMNISEPEFEHAQVKQLSQNSYQRRIQNTPYRVHEIRYAIFPQQSGQLLIPAMVFTASETVARRSLFTMPGQGKRIRKTSQPHRITVRKPPVGFTGTTWLPAQSLSLTESFSSELDNLHVGDSITRTIKLSATALLAAQLSPIEFSAIDGAKLYPDQGTTQTDTNEQAVMAQRIDSVAIIPTRAGLLTLPAVTIPWWDTQSNKLQIAELPSIQIMVKPALAGSQSTATPLAVDHSVNQASNPTEPSITQVPVTDDRWPLAAALLAIGWLITLLLWWRSTRLRTPVPTAIAADDSVANSSERQAFKALAALCASEAPLAPLRSATLNWARCYFASIRINSLEDVALAARNPALKQQLSYLDRSLYATTDKPLNPAQLISAIESLRKNSSHKKTQPQPGLAPLYAE